CGLAPGGEGDEAGSPLRKLGVVHPPPRLYPVPEYYPDLPGSVAQVVVGLVVWGYHWMLLKTEH
ncbi:MAG: hypothetical protein WC093_07275, partial [Methanoculleus sp.]